MSCSCVCFVMGGGLDMMAEGVNSRVVIRNDGERIVRPDIFSAIFDLFIPLSTIHSFLKGTL